MALNVLSSKRALASECPRPLGAAAAPGTALARPSDLQTLGHVLQWRAGCQADQVAFVFLVDGEDEEQALTYAQLDRRARAIAAELRRRGAVGEPGAVGPRALLVFDAGFDY